MSQSSVLAMAAALGLVPHHVTAAVWWIGGVRAAEVFRQRIWVAPLAC